MGKSGKGKEFRLDAPTSCSDITIEDLEAVKSSDTLRTLLPNLMGQYVAAIVRKKSFEISKRFCAYHERAAYLGISRDRAAEILDEEARLSAVCPNSLDALERASRRLVEDA